VLKAIMKQRQETKRLPIKYQRITGYVALVGIVLGSSFYGYYLEEFMLLFGIYGHIPLDYQVESGVMRLAVAALTLFSAVLCAYVGIILVALVFSLLMLLMGKFSLSEVIAYSFLSKYPVHWRIQGEIKTSANRKR